MATAYIGRFAPSPTGPLHQGSLLAALASYLDAKHHGGTWLLRIEDLDPPREDPSAPETIIAQLKAFCLHWDGEPLFQSSRLAAYEEALATLARESLTYPCTCARKSYAAVYPGTCDGRYACPPNAPHSIRLRVRDAQLSWQDRLFGEVSFAMKQQVGDFIIRRKDGLTAYQLAVVVDDLEQQITQVVRGADLLDSTPRQLEVYAGLGRPAPGYLHLPVLADKSGAKLSKQSHAAPVGTSDAPAQLRYLLGLLGQPIPEAKEAPALLAVAAKQWDISRVPRQPSIVVA